MATEADEYAKKFREENAVYFTKEIKMFDFLLATEPRGEEFEGKLRAIAVKLKKRLMVAEKLVSYCSHDDDPDGKNCKNFYLRDEEGCTCGVAKLWNKWIDLVDSI